MPLNWQREIESAIPNLGHSLARNKIMRSRNTEAPSVSDDLPKVQQVIESKIERISENLSI